MPVPVESSWSSEAVPTLKLSWSSLGASSSKQVGSSYIAHSTPKRNRQSIVVRQRVESCGHLHNLIDLIVLLYRLSRAQIGSVSF